MVLSVGDLVVATFSVEMSDSSDFSSRSRVPVEVAKSWPCSTKLDSFANPIFSSHSLPFHVPSDSHLGQGLDGSLLLTLSFGLWRTFDSWFQQLCLKLSPYWWSVSVQSFPEKGRSLTFCFGMNFLEISLSLGILDMSRLIFDLSLLTAYTFNSFTHVFLFH